MRLGLLPLLLTIFFAGMAYAKPAKSQGITDKKITLSVERAEIRAVLTQISRKTGVKFVYSEQKIPSREKVSLIAKDEMLGTVLNRLFSPLGVHYEVAGDQIILQKTEQEFPVKAVGDLPEATAGAGLPLYGKIIKGRITDEKQQPLAGVSVKIKGAKTGTYTNDNGEFYIEIPGASVLEISYVGFESMELAVNEEKSVAIQLKQLDKNIDAVVVVGYGKQKKISVVGSQATVNPVELKLPVRDLTNALAGRLAGVVAVQRSGEPGYDAASIFIRGISTFASSPQGPLLVVDGVPDRPINNLDPEDIESFTILKDASATAVYGTRGANGVILVYTKKGKAGKPQINVEANQGVTQFTRLPKFVDAPAYMTLFNEGLAMRGRTPQYSPAEIQKHIDGSDPDAYPNVDWFKELFNNYGRNNRINLNVTGGAANANYYISAGYYNEVGMFKRDAIQSYNSSIKYQRFNFTSNVNVDLTRSTKLELGVNGFIANGNYPGTGTSTLFNYAAAAPPHTIPARFSNGQWPKIGGTIGDPYMFLTGSGYATEFNSTVRSNIRVRQDLGFIVKGLSATSMFAFDNISFANLQRKRTPQTYHLVPRTDANGNPVLDANGLYQYRDSSGNLLTQMTDPGSDILGFSSQTGATRRFYTESGLNYSNTFGSSHNVSGMLLYTQSDYVDGTADNVIRSIPWRQRGLTGRATYGYKLKYFIEGNFGYTGTESFTPHNRYGFFPSLGTGWVVSNEQFFEPLKDAISHFKLRYSYGLSGNYNTNDVNSRFLFLTQITGGNGFTFGEPGSYNSFGGQQEGQVGSDVTWETSHRHNLGIEINAFHDNLQLIVELFKERRDGILLRNYTVPYASGYRIDNIPYGNIGITENKGVDISLTYNKSLSGHAFIGFTGTFNYNLNKDVYDGLPPWKYPWLNRTGHPISQRFGYIAQGLFKDSAEIMASPQQPGDVRPGDIRYKDINGDGVINSYDQVPIGYGSIPRIVYGLNFAFGYHDVDLSLFFQGVGQVDFNYSGGFATTPFSQGATYGNLYSVATDRWTPEYGKNGGNASPFYPRMSTNQDITSNYATSTWWIKRADYIRLKSAELGYNFSVSALKKFSVSKMRLFVNGTNLFTWSRWKFWDPELGDGRGTAYPNTTNYNVGFRVSFK